MLFFINIDYIWLFEIYWIGKVNLSFVIGGFDFGDDFVLDFVKLIRR